MGIELGKRISEALEKKKMSQKELALIIDVSEGVISRYISGARDPKPETIANIATALGTTSDFLLGIENTEINYPFINRIIARNASLMTPQERRNLIIALLEEDD